MDGEKITFLLYHIPRKIQAGNVENAWEMPKIISSPFFSRPFLEKKHVLCLIISLFNPQPTKERNWENEEEI